MISSLNEIYNLHMKKIIANMERGFKNLGRQFNVLAQNHTLKDELFNNGWYPIKWVSRFEKDPDESIDMYMNRLILDKYNHIKKYCNDLSPLRSVILEEAFRLFEEKNFIACIPLFLIQADGIARDYGTKGMFSGSGDNFKDPNSSKFIPYVHKVANEDIKKAAIFSILHSDKFISSKSYKELLISKDTSKTTPEENFSLNRHGILHGLIEYQGYANELNALRSICFLVYTINLGEDLKYSQKTKNNTNS